MSSRTLKHEDYTIGWICALEVELTAARGMLDEEHEDLPVGQDPNVYTLGEIGKHNVVIAHLPEGTVGTSAAATCATNLLRSFPQIRFGLLVGVGGAAPGPFDEQVANRDIRLGDIVVSTPTAGNGGVIQYDFGKLMDNNVFVQTGALNSPPSILRAAVTKLKSNSSLHPHRIRQSWDNMLRRFPHLDHAYPGDEDDTLYSSDYAHKDNAKDCTTCSSTRAVKRPKRRIPENPVVHHGLIGTANQVLKSALVRDRLLKQKGIVCFEMEAGGLMNDFPCLVIRGICDYCDSHKNKKWQPYAAGVAAAYAKELLQIIQPVAVADGSPAKDIMHELKQQMDKLNITNRMVEETRDHVVLHNLPFARGAMFDSFHEIDDLNTQCLDGTRTELLEEIQEWTRSSSGKLIFWLNGAAGTGKSTISRTVAADLASKQKLAASFFFRRGEADRSTASQFFSTIVNQLVRAIPALLLPVRAAIKKDPQIAQKVLREQFEKLILQPMSVIQDQLTNVWVIVVDALDECDSEVHIRLLIEELSRLREFSKNIRIFLTSRPELASRDGFERITRLSYQDLILHNIPDPIIDHDIMLFLTYRLDLIQKQSHNQLNTTWPGIHTLRNLLSLVRPLFICAATICRFIEDPYDDPATRLEYVLTSQDNELYDPIHQTYQPILERMMKTSTSKQRRDILDNFRKTVGVIIVLTEPLPMQALARLLDLEQRQVEIKLKGLHSVINVREKSNDPVRIFHKSFADFLLDQNRSRSHEFWVDADATHQLVGLKCLDLLLDGGYLKQDICNLRHPGILRENLDPILVDQHLPSEIQYACRYWVHHCTIGNLQEATSLERIYEFLKTHLIHWLEALCLLGQVHSSIEMISNLLTLAEKDPGCEMLGFLSDAQRFILANVYIADIAPLQLYSSCILFAPQQSQVRNHFKHFLPKWILRQPSTTEHWSETVHNLEAGLVGYSALAFSSDGKVLASSTARHDLALGVCEHIMIWDVPLGQLRQTLRLPKGKVESLAFSPDGLFLASSSSNGDIKLWNSISGILERSIAAHSGSVWSIVFSPKSTLLASGSSDSSVRLWDPYTGNLKHTLFGHERDVWSVMFSPNGSLLASGSELGSVKLWNPLSGQLIHSFEFPDVSIVPFTFSQDGGILTAALKTGLRSWNTLSGELTQLLPITTNDGVLDFVVHGQYLAVYSEINGHEVRLLDVASGSPAVTIRLGNAYPFSPTSSPNGRLLAFISNGGMIKIVDMDSAFRNSLSEKISKAFVNAVAQSPDGLWVLSSFYDKKMELWSTFPAARVQTVEEQEDIVTSIVFSPGGSIVAGGCNKTLKLWTIYSGRLEPYKTLDGHGRISDIAFSPCGNLLATLVDMKTTYIRHTHSWHMVETIHFSHAGYMPIKVSFHPSLPILKADSAFFTLKSSAQHLRQVQPRATAIEFQYQNHWIVRGPHRLLWLPPDYRPYGYPHKTFCSYGDRLFIGCELGEILFLELSSKLLRSLTIRRRSFADSTRNRPKVFERPKTMYL